MFSLCSQSRTVQYEMSLYNKYKVKVWKGFIVVEYPGNKGSELSSHCMKNEQRVCEALLILAISSISGQITAMNN